MKHRFPGAILFILAVMAAGCRSIPNAGFQLPEIDLFKEEERLEYPSSAAAENGRAEFQFESRSLSVIVNPSGSPAADGVIVTAIHTGQAVLVETADPMGRFLPSVQILPVTTGGTEPDHLQASAPQVPRDYRWNMMPVGPVSISALKHLRLGEIRASDLPAFLEQNTAARGINLLLPSAGLGSPDRTVVAYQTPASLTLLLLPAGSEADLSTQPSLTALSVLREDLHQLSGTMQTLEPPLWLDEGIPGTEMQSGGSAAGEDTSTAPAPRPEQPSAGASMDWMDQLPEEWTAAPPSNVLQAQIPETTPQQEMTRAGLEAVTGFLGTCPLEVHDRFTAIGPDGRTYRTWHPVSVSIDPGNPESPQCTFAHEHGDPPHPDAPPPLFGYAAFHAGMNAQITDHTAYKVFTHRIGGQTGWETPEPERVRPDWDMMVWLHMGTASASRLTTRWHEVGFWSRDMQDRITEIHLLADTGTAADGCGQQNFPSRLIASACDFSAESWDFQLKLDNWSGSFEVVATNPMTCLAGPIQTGSPALHSTSENICGTGPEPCRDRAQFGAPGSYWLGTLRRLQWPDWQWHNYGGQEFTCTDPYGIALDNDLCSRGEYGALRQRVPVLAWIGEPGQSWDRTFHEPDTALPVGAPGGN